MQNSGDYLLVTSANTFSHTSGFPERVFPAACLDQIRGVLQSGF